MSERRKPYPFDQLEPKWQALWEERWAFYAPNPGDPGFDPTRPKYYVLDMFPYPSGSGLHVGHPEGYTATDIVCRFERMRGATVLHPMGLSAQIRSGAVMGFGMSLSERHIYDPQNGFPGNVGLIQAKPASYLDVPSHMQTLAVDIQDPQNPVGSKGIGEPVEGCATAAVLAAIADALGGHYFNRVPVLPDMIVNAAAGREQSHKPLQVSTA